MATPTFSPSAGNYSTAQNIAISTTTSDASLYYTTDGTAPTTSSTVYSSSLGHIWFLAGKTIQAFATKSGLTDSSVLSGIFSYPPLKSGQTTCYDASGSVISCSGTNQDGESQMGAVRGYSGPTAHATYTSDYTTTDTATGLVWKTCSQSLSGATCAGTTTPLAWANAVADPTNGCNALNSSNSGNGYAGIKTWRLPTRLELESLVDFSIASPAINSTAFPNTASSNYWSSTTVSSTTANAWILDFSYGRSLNTVTKVETAEVRCVSGLPKEVSFNFTDNSVGTVKDNTTGLVWQKCSQGQNNDSTCSGTATTANWANAITNCTSLSLAGKTWRLPNVNELKTIVDTTKTSGTTIDTTAFPNTVAGNYWSSTSYVSDASLAWLGSFSDGAVDTDSKTSSTYSVRCVSGP